MKKGLGRGYDLIFEENIVEEKNRGVSAIRLSLIEPKKGQPRKNFDEEALENLSRSIADNGVLQPIIVRETADGMYQIIAGERRWRASKMAGLSEIPAVVISADEFAASKIAMIENLQREDLNPIEEARGYYTLMQEYSLTQEEVSVQLGKNRSTVANALRLLDLPDEVADMAAEKKITAGHCKALLGLSDREKILPFAQQVVKSGLSVRETEAMVRKANRPKAPKTDRKDGTIDYITDLENRVSAEIGRKFMIVNRPGNKFIRVDYTDNDDLNDLIQLICRKNPTDD